MGEIERGYSGHVNHPDVIAAKECLVSASVSPEKTAAPSSKPSVTTGKEAAGAVKLPHEARRPMGQIDNSFGSLETRDSQAERPRL